MPKKSILIFSFVILISLLYHNALSAETRNPNWAKPINLTHSENFYQITPNIFRSAQPNKEAFKEYEAFGIKSVINLRSNNSDKDLIAGTNLKLYEIKMRAWHSNDEDVIEVLSLIKFIEQNGPILIHCQHGADRTGLIAAMYRLVFQNWTKKEALDELKNGAFGYHAIWENIPKYIEQVNVSYIKKQL